VCQVVPGHSHDKRVRLLTVCWLCMRVQPKGQGKPGGTTTRSASMRSLQSRGAQEQPQQQQHPHTLQRAQVRVVAKPL
jgi:hypothetical protein